MIDLILDKIVVVEPDTMFYEADFGLIEMGVFDSKPCLVLGLKLIYKFE